jgi:hypothetical protein
MMLFNRFIKYFQKREVLLLVFLWALAEFLLYLKFGFGFEMEAKKYISEADFIIQNQALSQGRYLFYLSTILVIAVCKMGGVGLYGAVFLLMLINLGSYLVFLKALKKVFNATWPALLVITFLLSFWPYQSWTLYLFTENLFYSTVMLLFSHLLLYNGMTRKFIGILMALLLMVIISRPLGILFVFPVLGFLFFHFTKRQRLFLLGGFMAAGVLLVWVVQIVFTTTPDWNMQRAFLEENIICGLPVTLSGTPIDMTENPSQLYRLFYYITHNFSHFSGLALKRLQLFFLNTRNYYSAAHNIYNLVYIFFLYGSIIIGFRQIRKTFSKGVLFFIFSVLFLFALTVSLQCDDFHNRFFLTLMPLLASLGISGCLPLVSKLFSFFKNKI